MAKLTKKQKKSKDKKKDKKKNKEGEEAEEEASHHHGTGEIKVALTSFAFNNQSLIYLLRERGGYVAYQNYTKVKDVETKINGLIKDAAEFDKVTRPVAAFITFESEDGYSMAMQYEKDYDWFGNLKPIEEHH